MKENKIKIKLGVIGYLPFNLNRKKIRNLKSDIFEIVGEIDDYHFNSDSDTEFWGYSDNKLNQELPNNCDADFFIGITYVPIEDNYYARRLEKNRIVLSFYEMYQILIEGHIPVENLIFRVLYAYSLVYLRQNNTIPPQREILGFTHDDTRGCLFDMNGNKTDVLFSVDKPIICDDCTNRLRQEKVADNKISKIKCEIKRIKKKRFYKISDFVKEKPLLSIGISLIVGVLVSLTANVVFETSLKEAIKKENQIYQTESDNVINKEVNDTIK
nr:hypothetical protein [uncultured Draconibacterium sp.]